MSVLVQVVVEDLVPGLGFVLGLFRVVITVEQTEHNEIFNVDLILPLALDRIFEGIRQELLWDGTVSRSETFPRLSCQVVSQAIQSDEAIITVWHIRGGQSAFRDENKEGIFRQRKQIDSVFVWQQIASTQTMFSGNINVGFVRWNGCKYAQ